MPSKNYSILESYKLDICDLYLSGSSISHISSKHKCARDTVRKLLVNNGIAIRSNPKQYCNRKHSLDEYFFEKIDSPIKAYIIGLILADGSLISGKNKGRSHSITIELQKRDCYILKNINKYMNHTRPLSYRKRKETWQETGQAKIVSDKIFDDLVSFGLKPNKSFDCPFPAIHNSFKYALVRGIFDGDGCIHKESNKCGSVQIICSPLVAAGMSNFLNENDIIHVVKKINYYSKPLSRVIIYRLSEINKFYNIIYDDSDMFLKRKKEIFESFVFFSKK